MVEPSTGLVERLVFSLALNDSKALRTDVAIANPSAATQEFAHWTNVPMVPGGTNQLEDDVVLTPKFFDEVLPAALEQLQSGRPWHIVRFGIPDWESWSNKPRLYDEDRIGRGWPPVYGALEPAGEPPFVKKKVSQPWTYPWEAPKLPAPCRRHLTRRQRGLTLSKSQSVTPAPSPEPNQSR